MGLIELGKYKFKAFQGINRKDVEKLNRNGIKTARQILEIGYTKEGRNKLSKITNIPVDSILELVKLSDLARIGTSQNRRVNKWQHHLGKLKFPASTVLEIKSFV